MIPPDIPLFAKDFDDDERLYWEADIVFDLPVTSIDFGFDLDSVENEDADECVGWLGIFDFGWLLKHTWRWMVIITY